MRRAPTAQRAVAPGFSILAPRGTSRGAPHFLPGESAPMRAPDSAGQAWGGPGMVPEDSAAGPLPAALSSGPMLLTPSTPDNVLHSGQVRPARPGRPLPLPAPNHPAAAPALSGEAPPRRLPPLWQRPPEPHALLSMPAQLLQAVRARCHHSGPPLHPS